MPSMDTKLRIFRGLKLSAKFIGFPILGLLVMFLISVTFLFISAYAYYFPPALTLLGAIGFVLGYRGSGNG